MFSVGSTSAIHPDKSSKKSGLETAFEVLDVDHDGKISQNDLETFYADFSNTTASSNEGIIGVMMSVADSNKDGYVEYNEFEKVVDTQKNNGRWGVMEDAFRVMDKDGDGKVGYEDLKEYLNWAGFGANDDDIKAMIRLGGDENEGVTYEGFLKILAV